MVRPSKRRKKEGKIIQILERVSEEFIGILRTYPNFAIVFADVHYQAIDIRVNLDDLKSAKDGEIVVVRVTDWGKNNNKYSGVVTKTLGKEDSSDVEMQAILVNHGFPLDFPLKVMEETNKLPSSIPASEISKRRDFRETVCFTIDPEDAKDFDDAISLQFLEEERFEVGIHIADVSHYVIEGSALDKEAIKRSTSVYLVDRVLPMLPEKISNELCSLRPREDKLCFSAVFTFDQHLKLLDRWFGKTIIHSKHRFTYQQAQEILEGANHEFSKELQFFNGFSKSLREKKFKNGALSFDSPEVKFRLDEKGTPLEVYLKERKDAHMLIEDFMLLANREVASFISNKSKGLKIPFVYRIHDLPDPNKLAEFARFAAEMGVRIQTHTPKMLARSLNQLTSAAKENDALKILEPIAIRTMAKAEYSTDNIGHYGLAFDYYTHFTSPIRRYSDVLVHRILEKNINSTFRTDQKKLQETCAHISNQERKAQEAERESVKYKQVEFIQNHLGKVFEGQISGIVDSGFFIALNENKCEGFLAFERFDESLVRDTSPYIVHGQKSKKQWKIGDSITVMVKDADLMYRRIEFDLPELNF